MSRDVSPASARRSQSEYPRDTSEFNSRAPSPILGNNSSSMPENYSTSGITDSSDPIKRDAYMSGYSGYPPETGLDEKRPSQRPLAAFTITDWLWEIGAAFASICCLVAIIAILFTTHEKPLSSWHFLISPNALISIFSTLSKAALLVPVASCISQLKWIYFTKGPRALEDIQTFDDASRGPWGALTFLWSVNVRANLALCGSLITIVALAMDPFVQQIIAFPSRSVPSSTPSRFGNAQIYDSGVSPGYTATWTHQMDPKMQGAILNGLYSLDAPIQFGCPTSNCTWPSFTSLAVTSQCSNVTRASKVKCAASAGSNSCNYTTPSGFHIRAYSHSSSGGGFMTEFNSSAKIDWTAGDDVANSTLVAFATANTTANGLALPDLTECTMAWAARTFHNISVTSGAFSLGATSDQPLDPVDTYNGTTVQLYRFDVDGGFAGNRSFFVNPNDHGLIASYLQTIFSSDSTVDFGRALMKTASLADTVRNISDSMTYAVGRNRNASVVQGEALQRETYIRVRWAWLALPVAVVLLGVAFLAATTARASRSGVPTWKGSAVAPFFARLDGWGADELRVHSFRDVEARARRMRAVAVPGGEGGVVLRRSG